MRRAPAGAKARDENWSDDNRFEEIGNQVKFENVQLTAYVSRVRGAKECYGMLPGILITLIFRRLKMLEGFFRFCNVIIIFLINIV